MAKKATGKGEAPEGAIVYTHDDLVKFKVKYHKDVPQAKRYMKEGDVLTIHEVHAKTLVAKCYGEITEFLNDKRDKSLDKKTTDGTAELNADSKVPAPAKDAGKKTDGKDKDSDKKEDKKDPE